MKFISESTIKPEVKQDYAKSILFSSIDFKQPGHLLQTVTIPPNTRQRKHHHTTQTEVFYIVEGECHIFINDHEYVSRPGDAFITDPGDTHYLWNKSNQPFKLVVFKIDLPTQDDTVWSES